MLDDHTCDSNHKKMLSMMDTLRRRYLDATTMVSQTDLYYLKITCMIDSVVLNIWEHEVKQAEEIRHTDLRVMDIYAARVPDRLACESSWGPASAPASATSTASTPIDQWMEYLLLVEETQ